MTLLHPGGAVSIAICGVLGLSACADSPSGTFAVTDSAGVRLAVSRDKAAMYAQVEMEPVLTLGGADAAGPTQFFRVQDVHVDADGNLWVADGGSAEGRIFGPDGVHLKTVGGRGEGPGEFLRIRLLGEMHGDSIGFWDDANPRLTVYDRAGEFGRTSALPISDEAIPRAHGVFLDGTILAQLPRVFRSAALHPGQLLGDTARLVRVEIAGRSTEELGSFAGPTWLWTGTSQVPIPFTVNPGLDLHGGLVYVVAGPDFRVRVLGPGGLVEVVRVERMARNVDDHALARYAEFMEQALSEPHRSEYLSALEHPALPSTLPAYSDVVVSRKGAVWARVYDPDLLAAATWDVFGPNRELLGQVETPIGFTMTRVAGGLLYGIWRDELGVEHVRVYALRGE